MKKIKFLILWLVLSIIWLTSFSSANTVNFSLGSVSLTNRFAVLKTFYVDNVSWLWGNYSFSYSCSFGMFDTLWYSWNLNLSFLWVSSNQRNYVSNVWNVNSDNFSSFSWNWNLFLSSDFSNLIPLTISLPSSCSNCSYSESWFLRFLSCSFVFSWIDLYTDDDLILSSSCSTWDECPTCPTCEDCSSCQSSLGACLEDNVSLDNMNQSLSEELTSCLESWGSWCNPEVDTGCVEGAIVPLLSWSVWLDSFTTPIINNLTLPTNYKWKIEDWVLTIASINSNLSIDDSDYLNIKSVFISVVLYTFGLGLMLILVYYIKFYFFNIKDK